eukprot:2311186-Amphidinium_carterae.1
MPQLIKNVEVHLATAAPNWRKDFGTGRRSRVQVRKERQHKKKHSLCLEEGLEWSKVYVAAFVDSRGARTA